MKNPELNRLGNKGKIASIREFKPASKVSTIRKIGFLFCLFGIMLTINSCDSEDQTPPPVNEPDPTGTIVIKINTVGKDNDPDGYTLNVEGSPARQVGPTEEITISNKKVGKYAVELSSIATHCNGKGNMVREVNVTANGTSTVEFEVDCKAILRDRIAYNKGTANFTDFKFYSSKLDGTDEKLILDKVVFTGRMSISPDGTKIAFSDRMEGTTIQQVFVMDADGENMEMIPFEPNENPAFTAQFLPVWHPDGKKLTFRNAATTVTYNMETGTRSVLQFEPGEIFVVNEVVENGNKFLGIFIISKPGEPTVQKLATMNIDGSDIRILKEGTSQTFNSPTLMNGNTIAYNQRVNAPGFFNEVWTMNLDGTGDIKISGSLGFSESELLNSFTVSPDGTEFIFFISSGLNFYLARTKLNGTPQQLNFSGSGVRNNPVWSSVTRN